MATSRTPRFKVSRRLGINVFGHPKAMKRIDRKLGTRSGKKISEYGLQLLEKQKIKAYYGILERQFVRYLKAAQKSREMTGVALLKALERRLDNLRLPTGFRKLNSSGTTTRKSRSLSSEWAKNKYPLLWSSGQ